MSKFEEADVSKLNRIITWRGAQLAEAVLLGVKDIENRQWGIDEMCAAPHPNHASNNADHLVRCAQRRPPLWQEHRCAGVAGAAAERDAQHAT